MSVSIIKRVLLILLFISLFSCVNSKPDIIIFESPHIIQNKIQDIDLNGWHHMDVINDTIPGISLDKAYNKILNNKTGDTVIVAVIDTEVDLEHEDLVGSFWVNKKEIPDNNIDDDSNGYIDDIHGWNFLGNDKGENIIYANYEFIRIIRKYDSLFKNKTEVDIDESLKKEFQLYQKSLELKKEKEKSLIASLNRGKTIYQNHILATNFFKDIYGTEQIELDSIKKYNPKDSLTEKYKKDMLFSLNRGLTNKTLEIYIDQQKGLMEKSLNADYIDRVITGDNFNDIKDIKYGNNQVSKNLKELYHGTLVSGVLSGNRSNDIGIRGISDNIIIMPLAVSANGDELDKDIALAIRYAVDNGADVINMSSGKQYSLNKEWVEEALLYAAKKNVLFVTSAGNNNENLDLEENNYYPNDTYIEDSIVKKSFLMIGASSYDLNHKFTYSNTNYGKINVDIFAPGSRIYTTRPLNDYSFSNGTSMATPIVSGIAALIKSYYPHFSAAEIKDILLRSGTSYHLDVKIYEEDDTTKMIPFSELSKTGKVVNAYNALLMAKELSKSKK